MTDLLDGRPVTGIHRRVIDIIVAQTRYEESYLLPESHFEGELGIDSVLLESIVASVVKQFDLTTPLPGDLLTIQDLVDAVSRSLDDRSDGSEPARPVPTADREGGTGGRFLEALLVSAMRHTQYERRHLDLDADLEGELGIDSVVLTSIVADTAAAMGLSGSVPEAVGASTLREVLAMLTAGSPAPAAPPAADRDRPERRTAPPALPDVPAPAGTGRPARPPADRQDGSDRHPDPDGAGSWDSRSMKDFVDSRAPDLFAKTAAFAEHRRDREADQLYWYGMPLHSRCTNRAVIHDELTGRTREFLMFASNNYLGLANHPKVIDAVCDATRVYGATNTGCRLIGGTNLLHKELERRLAAFKQRPACIVFPGGYSANIGTISALARSSDTVVVDKLNHMSIVDGCRLSGAGRRIYQHNDMADLERVLDRLQDRDGGSLIVTDGVFSMHGDVCDLPQIVRLARHYGARVMVDDAHATGVLGTRGTGTAEHFGLKGEIDLELGTMSKTLAGMGGFVVGEEEVVDYLRYYADSYVFAATIPAGVAAGLIAAIDVLEAEPERVELLWSNIRQLRRHLLDAGFDLEHSESAILPIVIGDERAALEMGRAVRARGLFCQTVVFPGVPVGDARLRISVTSEHTTEDLAEAAQIFLDAGRETGVLRSGDSADGRPAPAGRGYRR